ncbi:hypothetical protein O6H91_20G036300 [Diphasiastrum complanatum]|uniref:Uncharacterized protein n=1 Tax=Diphasiastrum complanatum TaxID=34168 RepID=A0ACC2AP53_DIPCM|nr:hypothetical protein O6H91_20G036300 [Diphasiastrum complanatum]
MAMAMAMAMASTFATGSLASLLTTRRVVPSITPSSSFLPNFPHRTSSFNTVRRLRKRGRLPCVRALDVDQDTLLAIGVGLAGLAVGIGIPVFYEMQVKASQTRENDQPCFPCKGTGSQTCRFCLGAGNITLELTAGGEKEISKCINCEGAGSITCTTCQGSGIQPRYLDRREFKDDD